MPDKILVNTLTTMGVKEAKQIEEKLAEIKGHDQKPLTHAEYRQILDNLKLLKTCFAKLAQNLNEVSQHLSMDPNSASVLETIEKEPVLNEYYNSLRIYLNQMFLVAVTVNSGQIKVDIGICGLAAKG